MVVVLFVVPGTTEAAGPPPLTVRPGANSFGGQLITFSGDIGSGVQRIHLERRDRLGSPWGVVTDPRTGKTFTRLTNANGTFEFGFPAPAMNGCYYRVASAKTATQVHQFKTVHQDVDVSLIEQTPADVPLPRGFAVPGEGFRIAADTADHDRFGKPSKPILVGRVVTLQARSGDAWTNVKTATVGRDGWLDFGTESRRAPGSTPEVYRVRMADWTKDGDMVGWMPSLPFYLNVVNRPGPVLTPGWTATSTSVKLSWTLSPDPERTKIVIARTAGATAPPPSAGSPGQVLATLPGGTTSYTDNTVRSSTNRYAIYTVSRDGIYTAVPERLTTTASKQRGEG